MEGSAAMLAPLALVALGAIYFLPSIIAGSRGHMSAAAIVALNLLLGWTALGWILALVWSLNSNTRENLQYLATGERSSPPASAPRVIAATPPSSAPGTSVELHLSHLIPAVVLVAVALFGLIGWRVLRAEKAQDARSLQATAERIAAEHEAADRAELKRSTANLDYLNHALDDLQAHNPWAGRKRSLGQNG